MQHFKLSAAEGNMSHTNVLERETPLVLMTYKFRLNSPCSNEGRKSHNSSRDGGLSAKSFWQNTTKHKRNSFLSPWQWIEAESYILPVCMFAHNNLDWNFCADDATFFSAFFRKKRKYIPKNSCTFWPWFWINLTFKLGKEL